MNQLHHPEIEGAVAIGITDAARADRPAFDTIEVAAQKLGIHVLALRARCRRAAKRCGPSAVVELGGGIVAFKFGHTWRIRFPATLIGPGVAAGPDEAGAAGT